MTKQVTLIALFFSISLWGLTQTASLSGTVYDAATEQPLPGVNVLLSETSDLEIADKNGAFQFSNLPVGQYNLVFFSEGYTTTTQLIELQAGKNSLNMSLDSLGITLEAVEIEAERRQTYGLRRLRNVEGMAIYAAKKSEVIELDDIVANLATNNPRQVYRGIAGLNIWENDGAGLQLSIGARGLDPNRTSNFNTRQNGYDISADALGYPESYYTPPTQALQRIEIVRGAASLQYGTQFGGLLNFVFKEGPKHKPFEFITENTVGSFGFVNTFNSIGGTKGKVNYYAFFQHKQGDGWRPNSEFNQNTAFASVKFQATPKLSIGLEYTFMNYLAQQPGGLVDFEFEQNPRQSKRERNWFAVNWNLAALTADYRLSDKTKINTRNFFLYAQRDALGELGPINRPDPGRERDLIRGLYRNFGNETRLIHRYDLLNRISTFLIGTRYYQGFTTNQQGFASDGNDPDFRFLNPDDLEWSNYEFPSRNLTLFAENLFQISDKLTITPGLRLEYIRTSSEGYYKQNIFIREEIRFSRRFEDAKENTRSFALAGLGIGYKPSNTVELYANASQNYRAINFSDLAVVNPNLLIDSTLQDERGYNIDFGVRGTTLNEAIRFDASAFLLRYQGRIGTAKIKVPDPFIEGLETEKAFRTNIGDARIYGLELFAEADLWPLLFDKSEESGLSIFVNASAMNGVYIDGNREFIYNKVELIPPLTLKTGLNFRHKDFQASYQYHYVHEHFSDATNATFLANATVGLIPSYQVMDFSASYSWRRFRLQAGINNLADAMYFTRRATGYPGPGIIPADGRSFYTTLRIRL